MSDDTAPASRNILRAALTLAAVGLLAVVLLAVIHALTREPIHLAELKAEREALAVVLPTDRYDNEPLDDEIQVVAPLWLGDREALAVLRARRGGEPSALVLHAVAPDGYAGPIRLLVAVNADGTVSGVRVTRHAETPGLGDKIEAAKNPWIDGFRGRSLGSPPEQRWKVRKDRGDFDQFAGATITPRAVVAALARTLRFVAIHGAALYDAKPGDTLRFADGPDSAPADESAPPEQAE